MIIALKRDANQPHKYCTLGVLEVPGRGRFQSIERPWIPSPDGPCGMQGKSCIAPGTYRMEPRFTEARGKHWILSNPQLALYRYPKDIPTGRYGRSLVLIHAANWAHELHGCIAPGKARSASIEPYHGEWGVTASRAAMNELWNLVGTTLDLWLDVLQ